MVQQIFAFSSIGAGVRIDLDSPDGEDAFVGSNAVIGSEDGIAIQGTGSGHLVNVQGTVVGTTAAIKLGDSSADIGNHLLIGDAAYVAAAGGVFDTAVMVQGDGSVVDNRGAIWGAAYGLAVGGDGGGSTKVTNSGLIEGVSSAVMRFFASTETISLNNTGEIRSLGYSYNGAGAPGGRDFITNSGLMEGQVSLAGGNDRYDGRLGRVVGEVFGGDGADVLLGGAFSEDFTGEAGDDTLDGGDGDDELDGGDGDDSIAGGNGNDELSGGGGADFMAGGAGDDFYQVENAGDVVSELGGSGLDGIVSSISFNLSGAKVIGAVERLALTGNANINGTGNALANAIYGNAGNNVLGGGGGVDEISGEGGNDTIAGGDGNDYLAGGNGADNLAGGAGNDFLAGGSGADSLNGGAGNDTYYVDDGGDVVSEAGGSGLDSVVSAISFSLSSPKAIGAIENLTLTGSANINGTGNTLGNEITGNAGNNILDGLAGNDKLAAGAGLDTLRGGQGNDTLVGGAAKDIFVFNTAPNTVTNRDVIQDFVHGLDKLHLENAVFAKLGAAGALNAANFRVGATALDADDFIVYNKATGVLSYDVNGNGAGGAVQFAVLTNKPTLTTADFLVI